MEANGPPVIVSLASKLHFFAGIVFTIGSLPFALYVLANHKLPEFLGIRFYGGGFIERAGGIETILQAGWASLLITPVNILVGYWLAQSLRVGGVLGLVLFPVSMFFALGFAAPVPIALHSIMAVAVLMAWGHLK